MRSKEVDGGGRKYPSPRKYFLFAYRTETFPAAYQGLPSLRSEHPLSWERCGGKVALRAPCAEGRAGCAGCGRCAELSYAGQLRRGAAGPRGSPAGTGGGHRHHPHLGATTNLSSSCPSVTTATAAAAREGRHRGSFHSLPEAG